MQLQENADVFNAHGERIGRIYRIVVDPKSKEVTHIVTRKGILFAREKVIPLDQIQDAAEDKVVLKKGAGDPEKWPDFERGIFQRQQAYTDLLVDRVDEDEVHLALDSDVVENLPEQTSI